MTQSLSSLKREIAKEKAKVAQLNERIRLERELKQVRRSGKSDVAARVGRGFVILSKKASKAAVKGAKEVSKFAEERGGGEFFDTDFSGKSSVSPRRKIVKRDMRTKQPRRVMKSKQIRRKKAVSIKRKRTRKRGGGISGMDNIFAPLDF